jgi:hypothetical protein
VQAPNPLTYKGETLVNPHPRITPASTSDTPATDTAGSGLAALLGLADLTHSYAELPQAQGDVLVQPWPEYAAPTVRAAVLRTARQLPVTGRELTRGPHPHTLIPDGPGVRVARDTVGAALTVLLVEPGSVAVLGHHEHADLRIGPGLYLLRRQRRYTPAQPESLAAYVAD